MLILGEKWNPTISTQYHLVSSLVNYLMRELVGVVAAAVVVVVVVAAVENTIYYYSGYYYYFVYFLLCFNSSTGIGNRWWVLINPIILLTIAARVHRIPSSRLPISESA